MANNQADDSYRQFLELGELESLQEEIEETDLDPDAQWAELPALANNLEDDDNYRQLLELEELESLREEIEETGLDADTQWAELPADLVERLASFDINNSSDLVTRIAYMHAGLDEA